LDHLTGPSASLARRLGLVGLGGAVIGTLTSLGQTYLPFELSPLANSAGSWSLAAFLLALNEGVPRRGAVLGTVALVTMLAGYVVATRLRGFPVGTNLLLFWSAASVVVGPALGAGAAWVRRGDALRRTAGVAVIAGILIGEAVYGVTVIGDTTPAPYWFGEMALAGGVVILASGRWARSGRHLVIGLALTAIVAAAFYVTYSGNLIALF
jgi:hypothetical protein